METTMITIKTIMDDDKNMGGLTFLEAEQDIPFPIRRLYWIHGTEAGERRGFHAHRQNRQLLFCPYGAIDILMDDGKEKETVTLDDPSKGLIVEPHQWHEMTWRKSGSILCVAASEHYNAADYIRDYDEFLRIVQREA